MPLSDQNPLDLSAHALSRLIHSREVTCVAVMEAALARIAEKNPLHNAIVSLEPEATLLEAARTADAELADGRSRGWLHGFPMAIKDLSEAKGLPCTWGSLIFKDHVSEEDDLHVARIRKAGAILIGKTNTPEMGLGSHTTNRVFGPARNAFDPSRSAGGSSGGASVALSLGMVPLADGSDMMGSLRNPAAFNGIYGFRPSYGRLPDPGAKDLYFSQLATAGPMARTVADLAGLYATMAGSDLRDPMSLDDPGEEPYSPLATKGLKVGWMGDLGGHLAMEEGVLDTCGQALAVLEGLGTEVIPVVPEFDMDDLWFSWTTLRSFSTGFTLLDLAADDSRRDLLGPQALWEVENRRSLTLDDLAKATAVRSRWYECLLGLFNRFDFLALSSAQVFPFSVEALWPEVIAGRRMDTYHRWMEVVIGPSLAGLPVASVPAGLGKQGIGQTGLGQVGLPAGVQLIGPPRADMRTLRFAGAYEQAILASGLAGVRGVCPVRS